MCQPGFSELLAGEPRVLLRRDGGNEGVLVLLRA